MRWLLIILFCTLTIAGLFAGVFADSIQQALTLPPRYNMPQQAAAKAPMPTRTATAAMTVTATVPGPTPITANVLARDTFRRADQAFWGTGSDGRVWEGDANNQQFADIFSVASNTGVIMHGQGTLNALLGPTIANAEVLVTGSMSHFDGNVNFGVVLRWTDNNNWYKALIDGTNLTILKHVNGVTTQLGVTPFIAQGNISYTLRFRAIGANLFARVWPSADPEPTTWMMNITDMSLASGQGGIRVLVQNDVVVKVTSFLETAASSGM